MARRSQCSSAGDNPLDPNYLPPHYREEYRLAVDALVENSLDGYYQFLQKADVVDFLSTTEIQYIQNSVQIPTQSNQPEQYFPESRGDGSSDTYWPIHSDQEVPDLDLGWPQVHAFVEPTEITTFLNPPEADMPSIKEHARRLIKNAQQVVAVVMDMFTDVDMFLEILNAASRRVAVYILLDEVNAHHFVNMVANCRVNLQDCHCIRVRTVSGIAYQCRSGKSFKGQMLDRFLLTDCRAVLSGNYSFMWSFEKLHRCMAHLFLGQFVTTFDEEFRILYAQSQPLIIEDVLAPMEDLHVSQKTHYPTEYSLTFREPRKFLSPDSGHPDEWARHSYDERMDGDWRMTALKKQDSLRGPGDVYNRFASPQSRMEPCFDPGPSRILMTENPALKRHSYAEGVQGRYNPPFIQQQGMLEPEPKGKLYYRGQPPYPGPGPEADYSGYDKFWNQDYLATDKYVEPGLPQEVPPPDNFDLVHNYLSSTRNQDFDQSSEKFLPPSHPNRLNLDHPYVCQTSPTPSNSAEQKPFLQDSTANRKDPTVKQGLRNWRISSYLSAYDNPEEEGLSSEPSQAPDAFEEPPNPIQQSTMGKGLSVLKIPNLKEFKVPAAQRMSQMPSYAKATIQEKPKKFLDEPAPVVAEIKITPASSESFTHEEEKMDEAEQKEPANTLLRRDDSFRRKYSSALQRSSRLRSSLIYSTLEQQQAPQEPPTADQHEEVSDKNQTEQTKLPLVSHILGQRKPVVREPFEWSRYIKSATEAIKPDDVSTKADDKDSTKQDNLKDISENSKAKESLKLPEVGRNTPSPSVPQSKLTEVELSKTDKLAPAPPTPPLFTDSIYVDMNDPDKRLMFFKELAAKRKLEKEKEKAKLKPKVDSNTSAVIQKEESLPKRTPESIKGLTTEGLIVKHPASESAGKSGPTNASDLASLSLGDSKNINKKDSVFNSGSNISNTQEKETRHSEKLKLDIKPVANVPGLAETEARRSKSLEKPNVSNVFTKDSPTMPQSKPSEPKPPKTDQPVQPTTSTTHQPAQPTQPKIKSPLYVDMSDPNDRFMFFKELAAKRKAAKAAEAEKEKMQSKPQMELKNTLAIQKEEPPLKVTSGSSEISITECLVKGAAAEKAEETVTRDGGENTNRKDSVVNNEQETKLPISAKPESRLFKSPEEPAVSDSFVKESTKATATPDVSSVAQGIDKIERPSPQSTSEEFISVPPSSKESTLSLSLHTDSQNLESVQLEPSPPLPFVPDTSSELSSSNSLVQSSSSDLPLLNSCSQNSPSITEETSSSDSSSTHAPNTSHSVDEANAQEFVSSPSQESSQSTNETLDKSDDLIKQTHLDSVPHLASIEHLSADDSANVEFNISPSGPTPNILYPIRKDEELPAAIPSTEGPENNVSESSKAEPVVQEYNFPDSAKDATADSKSPVSPSIPKLSSDVSDLESFASENDLKGTVTPTTADAPSKQVPSEPESLENTDVIVVAPPSEITTPQDMPAETVPLSLNRTDSDTPIPAGTEICSLSEPNKSVLSPETKSTETILLVLDTNSCSSEAQSKTEESPVHQSTDVVSSSSESTSKAPAEAVLPSKVSETSEIPTLEPTEESSEIQLSTDEKTLDKPEDMKMSEISGTQVSVNVEINQNNCSESTETTLKQPKLSQSRYSSSTANVLSSSNLRDDTKLLLEQISANCQSRNEATKESPVTDDEKEDKADKNAKNEKDRRFKTFSRGQPPNQDQEKLLERIQCMRKERKVYSRFEMTS